MDNGESKRTRALARRCRRHHYHITTTTTTTTTGTEKRADSQATVVPLNFTFTHLAWTTPILFQAKVTWVVHHDTGFKVLS